MNNKLKIQSYQKIVDKLSFSMLWSKLKQRGSKDLIRDHATEIHVFGTRLVKRKERIHSHTYKHNAW